MREINDAVETGDNQSNIIFEKVKEVRTGASEEVLTFNREETLSYCNRRGENYC